MAGKVRSEGSSWQAGWTPDSRGPVLQVSKTGSGAWTYSQYGTPGGTNCALPASPKGGTGQDGTGGGTPSNRPDCPSYRGGGDVTTEDDSSGKGAVSPEKAQQAVRPVLAALGQKNARLDAAWAVRSGTDRHREPGARRAADVRLAERSPGRLGRSSGRRQRPVGEPGQGRGVSGAERRQDAGPAEFGQGPHSRGRLPLAARREGHGRPGRQGRRDRAVRAGPDEGAEAGRGDRCGLRARGAVRGRWAGAGAVVAVQGAPAGRRRAARTPPRRSRTRR